jgi:peptidoglycan hydrolase-like protein with peptidoglycan-binding domain
MPSTLEPARGGLTAVRLRVVLIAVAALAVAFAALAGAALAFWPQARLSPSADALAHVSLPGFAGHVSALQVRLLGGGDVPVEVRGGDVWPLAKVAPAERLTVAVTVQRPRWVGWLIGHVRRRTFPVVTPSAHLQGRWLQVDAGAPVSVAFDRPVARVSIDGAPVALPSPRAMVPIGVTAAGSDGSGTVTVAAAVRPWELLSDPLAVSWFPARPYAQLLATPAPAPAAKLAPAGRLTLTFSQPVADVLGAARPRVSPVVPGDWALVDAHTLAFEPRGMGFGLGASVRVELPIGVHLAGRPGAGLTRTLRWQVPGGSTLRLQQLLAELGYLPVDWLPTGVDPTTVEGQLDDAAAPPDGRFVWRFPNDPPELRALWSPGRPNQVTRGAVMMFEDTHGLPVDGLAGPRVWSALIADALAGRRHGGGYTYVFVHRSVPQSLNLWHDGRVILSSPGNTGVPAAPTELGTFPVFEHIPVGTMSGTNPDGSQYDDPGIRYISYFNHGEAIHAFNRASYGTPQSLGCVELPLAAAAKVWPYTPIGTLVTIEN